jgi:hypothetical protein
MSWRSLILMAVADAHEFFSPEFLAEMEQSFPFRFEFLRARRERLAGSRGLYANLFDAFLEPCDMPADSSQAGPLSHRSRNGAFDRGDIRPALDLMTMDSFR